MSNTPPSADRTPSVYDLIDALIGHAGWHNETERRYWEQQAARIRASNAFGSSAFIPEDHE